MRIRVLQFQSESTLLFNNSSIRVLDTPETSESYQIFSGSVRLGMNYGRGFPLPHYRNTDSWNPANGIPIPPDDGIGQTRGSWTAAMLGGPIPGSGDLCETPITTIPVNNGVRGKESESWMPTQVGNGIMGHRDSWTEIHQENGIAQNGGNWNPVIPNGNTWTPVTPVKPTNLVTINKPTNQLENENWGDLVGMYKDLLREEPINLNEVAQEVYPIDGNQNRCVRRNLNPMNLTPIPKPNRDSNPISYFTSEDPANWDGNLLSAIMRPKRSVESVPFLNRPQNNDVHDLNRIPVSDSSTQIQRNIIGPNRVNSVLENQQSHTFTLNNILGGYNSKKLPTDGFPVPYRPCYNLNSPPRSEPDATSSGITGPLPFAPITPDTGRKQTETQWVPAKNTQESQSQSQRKEITDNHENDQLHNIVESTSSAISTTQKDNLVCEEGDEMGIDLNKTPNQKTPARRKKHRPKVIREKKPKKTKTPKDPNETPVKRKYVRKKVVDVSESPKENGIEVSPSPSPNGARVKRKYVRKKGVEKSGVDEDTGSKVKTPLKSCKKQLNFDLECVRDESQTREESQMREGINLNVNPQDIEHEKRVNSVLERSGIKVAENYVNGLGSPMGKTRDHALNILARNLSMRNGYKSQVGQSQSQMVNVDEQRGIKRQIFEQVNPRNLNAMDSLVMYQKLLLGGTARVDRGQDLASVLLESHKRTKTHNGVSALEDNSRTYRNVPAMQLLNSCSQRVNLNYQMMNGGGGNVTGHFRPPVSAITQNLQKHPEPSGILQRQLQGNRANNMTAMVSWNRPPATPPKEYVRSGVITYPGPLLDKKRTPTPNSSNQKSNLEVHQKPTKPRGAPRKQKVAVAVSVEDITCMLERLCIYNENEKMRNALVPYKGSNVIVPFEPIKKRKPRPKVDLDPESDRLWRLLMGPEGSEANENMDKDKEKWWENERRVFRGRADSFIARMHLVQGDRRFSRWKGSVVDSVIGVFLTQNVSDHLSSSAFMSLAAKFSVKSTNMNETHGQNRTCVVVEEPIDTILPNDNVKCQQKIGRQPVFNQTSILSQDSLDSSTIQTVDEIRSSSGSNSEAEDQTTEPGPTNPIQPEKVNMFNKLFSRETTTTPLDRSQYVQEIPKMPQSGSPGFGVLGGESVSSLPSGYHTSNVTYQNEANSKGQNYSSQERVNTASTKISRERKAAIEDEKKKTFDWDSLRRDVFLKCEKKERSNDAKDSLDYEALRNAHVNQISDAIRERGMNNLLADRIKDFLDRLVRDHGSIDLEWLRDVPPDKAKDYLLSIRGLGLKSVECVRLLTLHHLAFPVDTNVGRIAVRLGWVPLQPLPESLQLHLLEMYPVLESIQKYLWPRLCKLDQLTLYELHYQMITFGKVFCTKSKPNCNACPMRAECRHFASAFASARLALPGPEEKKLVPSVPNAPNTNQPIPPIFTNHMSLPPSENNNNNNNTDTQFPGRNCEPIIEEPTTPEAEPAELSLSDIEDQYYEDDDEIPTIKLDMNEFTMNLQKMQESMDIQGDMSQALVALNPQAASIPTPKLKNVSRLRTEHQVYELPDSHPILEGLDRREPDDPSPYLLAIWTPGETANSMQPPERGCQGQETGILCDKTTCFSCNCIKEANSQVVRGTILMPCRTAMRGSFPLNGTYFQVNEMFADHSSSLKPIEVPRAWIWNLPRRTVYFGTSVSTIFKGLTTQEIQQCFWRGFVCVRGFDQKSRSPRPLMARLHFPASKLVNNKKNEDK